VTRYPKASDISSPPCLLRLLPAGANRRAGLAPAGKRRLVTAHPHGRHLFPYKKSRIATDYQRVALSEPHSAGLELS
jgi:hypothetical protein